MSTGDRRPPLPINGLRISPPGLAGDGEVRSGTPLSIFESFRSSHAPRAWHDLELDARFGGAPGGDSAPARVHCTCTTAISGSGTAFSIDDSQRPSCGHTTLNAASSLFWILRFVPATTVPARYNSTTSSATARHRLSHRGDSRRPPDRSPTRDAGLVRRWRGGIGAEGCQHAGERCQIEEGRFIGFHLSYRNSPHVSWMHFAPENTLGAPPANYPGICEAVDHVLPRRICENRPCSTRSSSGVSPSSLTRRPVPLRAVVPDASLNLA